ncbi:ATP-binding cassette, subfamily B, AbcA/BmrA [Alkalibacterium putridalgicola]|uniref:ABC transporter ATP-binding protein n=1 Tax=Alkalibacterium putridalgicola TaxID=426703 RepID=A0A1H7SDY7_9LACT|nr:ABC transporter ATP-binding protein [Alkalibacterium putridalgicola]GEK88781.1 ABC transporter ATP-binding protein [Alkalibacterium putridalgicola]SEL70891.1 ATP-binding cassette, subfamily B, AbcA/BmrA [Alkalibacterium putridalgicola]
MDRKRELKTPTKQDLKKFSRLLWSTNISKGLIAIGLAGSIISTVTQLMIPLATQQFIDGIEFDFFTPWMIGAVIGIFIVQVLFNGFSNYVLHKIGQHVVAGLREFLWNKIIRLPVSFFDRYASGEIVSRLTNDTSIVQNLISSFFPQFINGILTLIGIFFILIVMDWQMTLVMLTAVPLALILTRPLGKRIAKVSREMQDETAQFSGKVQQTIAEIRLMKSSTAETFEKNKGEQNINKLYRIGLKEGKYIAIIGPLMYTLMMGVMVFVIGYGGVRVARGVMTTGQLVAFLLYLFQVIFPITTFMNFFMQIQKAAGATERIAQILDEKEEEKAEGKEVAIDDLPITFDNVSFSYESDKEVIRQISFETQPGEKIAFAGPSGGGKSTLFALLERFYTPDSGEIRVGDMPVEEISLQSWRSQIGYVSQENAMMSGTIRENLCYGLPNPESLTEDRLWEVLEMAYAKTFIEQFPDKLEEEIGERGIKLSGGQRQRINIARAFLRNPKILMMDEATASLDSQSEKIVSQALNKLMEGRTTFVIAHRLSTILDADKILFIEEGRLTGMGQHHELLKTHPLYQLFASQQLSEER